MKTTRKLRTFLAAAAVLSALPVTAALAQKNEQKKDMPKKDMSKMHMPKTPKQMEPYDLTGYWVSIVDENWRFRMVTPPKGDFEGIFITPKAKKIANEWDPEADKKNGLACKAYGGAAIMQVPTRIHISWMGEDKLKFEFDAGRQTRVAYFHDAPGKAPAPGWQGVTKAQWEMRGTSPSFGAAHPVPIALKTITTKMRPGYIRKNGVPYSANAKVTEYYDLLPGPDGIQYLVVKTIVNDPEYLTQPYVTSSNFKKIPAKSGWDPRPCTVK